MRRYGFCTELVHTLPPMKRCILLHKMHSEGDGRRNTTAMHLFVDVVHLQFSVGVLVTALIVVIKLELELWEQGATNTGGLRPGVRSRKLPSVQQTVQGSLPPLSS